MEEIFDFGGVTFRDSKIMPLTLENESNIEAKLIVDLREFPEFELMFVEEGMEKDDLLNKIIILILEERHNFQKIDEMYQMTFKSLLLMSMPKKRKMTKSDMCKSI